jgi:hypothetical protein
MGQCASKRDIHVYHEIEEQRNQQLRTKLQEDFSKRTQQINEAVESEDLEVLHKRLRLLKPNVDDVLHSAFHSGKLEVAQYLVDCENADVDHQDLKGWTILHHSVHQGRLDFVRWILCRTNASVDIRDLDGETPLHKLKSVNFNAREGEKLNPNVMFEILRLLIEEGEADVSATNHDGHTFLQLVEQRAHGKTHADHFPAWMKVRSGVDSYAGFAESDYDLESTTGSVACSALSLSHYHVDAESDINDDGHFYSLAGSDSESYEDDDQSFGKLYDMSVDSSASDNGESTTEKRPISSVADWIAYLSAVSMEFGTDSDGSVYSDQKKVPSTPETSMEEEDTSESPLHLTPTYDLEEEEEEEEGPEETASSQKMLYLPEKIVEYDGVWPRAALLRASDSLVEYSTHDLSETESTFSLREIETRTFVSI